MPAVSSLISACILARNEERRIEDALRSLQSWTDEILVIDNESEDGTAAIARRYTDRVLTAPRDGALSVGPWALGPGRTSAVPNAQHLTPNAPGPANFDALRNLAIEHATGGWIFYLDADERVPPALGPILRQLVQERGDEFEALLIPFKHYFCGKWIQHSGWSPGYTRPQLLKKGRFRYNERLHSGVEVDGRILRFPADNPDLAIIHYSYDDLHHYLEKLNRYTDGEAENLLADGAPHTWQAQLAHFVADWQQYYERGRGDLDGMHGFVLAFMSAFYRFAARAKLWDLRRHEREGLRINTEARRHGGLSGDGAEEAVPASLSEMIQLMAHVAQHGPGQWLAPSQNASVSSSVSPCLRVNSGKRIPLLWRGPLFGASGFADEARQFVLGLIEAGEPIALAPEDWRDGDPGLPAEVRARLEERVVPEDKQAEVCVHHTLLRWVRPSPHARVNVARALFETDRLPAGAPERLNAMDRVWVPSEFNRETFVRSGVDPDKIAVIPEALDPAPFAAPDLEPWPLPGEEAFRFLAVFDWTLHKGWDVLLEAFAREFGPDPQVGLILKIWSSSGYTLADIRAQADAFLHARLGSDTAQTHRTQAPPSIAGKGAGGLGPASLAVLQAVACILTRGGGVSGC